MQEGTLVSYAIGSGQWHRVGSGGEETAEGGGLTFGSQNVINIPAAVISTGTVMLHVRMSLHILCIP
jgi:hypothetical protein